MTDKEFPTYFTDKHALSMTLRDYFAAKAMQSLLSNPNTDEDLGIAEAAFKVADAMLKWKEK